MGVSTVSKALSRKRFLSIKSKIHFLDNNTLNENNKMAKVEPLYSTLNASFIKYGIFHNRLSTDESMVPNYGRYSCKIIIPGKSIRFGYKFWSLCESDGYPHNLNIYKGKFETRTELLGSSVVNAMVNVVIENSVASKDTSYFDNLFTSYDLLNDFGKKGIKAIGTVQENRAQGASKILMDTKSLKKSDQGTFNFHCDGNVYFCKWNDNAIDSIGSNFTSHIPVSHTKRRVKNDKDCSVTEPNLMKEYNINMGGVDVLDHLLGSYRLTSKVKSGTGLSL